MEKKNDKTNEDDCSYVIAIIDLIDAYHYADFFDEDRYAWLGWQDYAKYTNYDMVVDLADRLFWALNPEAETQSDWIKWDAGYDVRVYDNNNNCVYKAHEKLPDKNKINDKTSASKKQTDVEIIFLPNYKKRKNQGSVKK